MATDKLLWCLLLMGAALVASEEVLTITESSSSDAASSQSERCRTSSLYPECLCIPGDSGSLSLQCAIDDDHFMVDYSPTSRDGPGLKMSCPCESNTTIYNHLEQLMIESISWLDLTGCPFPEPGISHLFGGWTNVSSIQQLRLRSCSPVETLERGLFTNLSQLKVIHLQFNSLSSLPHGLFQDTVNLRQLWLNNNLLETINENLFENLTLLAFLQLGSNKIHHLENRTFSGLTSLTHLYLESNELEVLPPNLLQPLANLSILDLSNNRIAQLDPDTLQFNTELTELGLRNNPFDSLPSGLFRRNSKLKSLSLQGNPKLSSIASDAFQSLTLLQTLDLSGCNLIALDPAWFAGLRSLTTLKLNRNALTSLADGNTFRGLTALKELYLSDNQLAELTPDALRPLVNLEKIDLSGNALNFSAFVPAAVDLTFGSPSPLQFNMKLREMDLSGNRIEHIYYDWGNMNNLVSLNLSHNYLSSLSFEDLSYFAGTIELDASFNQIRHVNFELAPSIDVFIDGNAPKRSAGLQKILYLDGNPLTCDCMTYNFVRYVNRSLPGAQHSWSIEASELTCQEPEELRGLRPILLDPDRFTCPCQSAALNASSCLCTRQPSERLIRLDCRQPNVSEIPHVQLSGYRIQLKTTADLMERLNVTTGSDVASLDLSQIHLTSSVFDSPWWRKMLQHLPSLTRLDLSHNQLTVLPSDVLDSWNGTQDLLILLTGNPWECSCKNRALLELHFSLRKRILDYDQMTCQDGETHLPLTELICAAAPVLRNAIVAVPLLALAFLVAFIVVYRFRKALRAWAYNRGICLSCVTKEEEEEDNARIYDAFISFSHKDEDFVVQQLVPELERPRNGEPAYRLCLHYRDWLAGEWIPDQIARSVTSSKRTMVILSEHFLESLWGKLEFRTAYQQLLTDKRMRLIIIVKGDLPPKDNMDEELKSYLSLNTYLKWGDPWFWDRLRYALPHKGNKDRPGGSTRISQAIIEHGQPDSLSKAERKNGAAKLNQLPPLPLLADRTNHRVHVNLPPDIEMSLTPTSSASSTAPIFPITPTP